MAYTFGNISRDGLSLDIIRPTNISRNEGQMAQKAWPSDNTPASTYCGKGGFANLLNCMEIDWGNAKGDTKIPDISDLSTANGSLRNIKSSFDVLRVLFWCYNKINNTEVIYVSSDKTTIAAQDEVTQIFTASTNPKLLNNISMSVINGSDWITLNNSEPGKIWQVTARNTNRFNLKYDGDSISRLIIGKTVLEHDEEIDVQIIPGQHIRITYGEPKTATIKINAGKSSVLPNSTITFNIKEPNPTEEYLIPSYAWSITSGYSSYITIQPQNECCHVVCTNNSVENKTVTLKCDITWPGYYVESISKEITIKGKTEYAPQPEKTLSIIAKYNNENITSTLLPYNAKIDLIAEYSDGSEISDNITWTIVQGSGNGNRANLGATSDSNAITTTGKQTTLWSKNDYNKIINNTSGEYDGSETSGNTTLNKSDSYKILFRICVGHEIQTTANNTIKVECKDSTGLTSQIIIYVKGYENIIYDSSLINNIEKCIYIDESGSEGFDKYFNVKVNKYYPNEQTRSLFYYKWTFTSKYTNTSDINGKIVFFNNGDNGYDNKDIKPEFNITLSGINESTNNYWYIGTEKPTSLSQATIVSSYSTEDTFTNPSQTTKCYVYALTNADKTVNFYDSAMPNTPLTTLIDTTSISGYKITCISSDGIEPSRIAKGGSVIYRIS